MNYEILPYVPPATLKLTCTRPGTSSEYSRYLSDAFVRTDSLNKPTLLDFSLAPADASFVKLQRGDYLVFDTVTYPKWFTGYITNDPELTQIGKDPTTLAPIFGYKYEASSDEILLSLKPLGIVAPFMNTTQGAILKSLINLLQPGKFDVTGISDGQTVARYVVDPAKKFQDVVKEFADAANFKFYGNNGALFFEPQGVTDAALVIDGQDRFFTPSNLKIKPTTDPIVNDAIVLGDVEPQGFVTEYFVGDGFEGAFPLMGSPFGTDSAVLLDEQFQNSSIDETKWNVYDVPQTLLKPDSGFLNVLGGLGISDLGVYITSASLIPVEGSLRITHGEYDFVNNASEGINGTVCGLWAGAPAMDGSGNYPGCIYGIEVKKTSGVTTLRPIVNGVVDVSQSVIVDFSRHYIFRTILYAQQIFRMVQQYSYQGVDGSMGNYGGGGSPDIAAFGTIISSINPNDLTDIQRTNWFSNSVPLSSNNLFAYYVPAASNDLHCTLTNITISTPMQAKLSIKPNGQSEFVPQLIGPNEIDSFDGLAPVATVATTNAGVTQKSSILGSPKYNPGNATLTFFKDTANQTTTTPQPGDMIRVKYRQAGAALGRVRKGDSIQAEADAWGDDGLRSVTRQDLSPLPRTSLECEAAAAAIVADLSYQHYEGTYICQAPGFSTTGDLQSGTILQFRNMPSSSFPVIPVTTSFDKDGNPLPPPPYTSNINDVITQVKTTILSAVPNELFEHEITFGKTDKVTAFLATISKPTADQVFTPQDSVQVPQAIDLAAVGTTFAPDVVNAELVSFDRNFFNFDTGQDAPVGGGFEVRYTDASWGCEPAKNLILRTSSRTFQVPRNQRGKTVFIKAYDVRNKILWSNDQSQSSPWFKSNTAVVQQSDIDPDQFRTQINILTMQANGYVSQTTNVLTTNQQGVFTTSIKGPVGRTVRLAVYDSAGGDALNYVQVTLNGNWQRVSVPASGTSSNTGFFQVQIWNTEGTALVLRCTRNSFEVGTQTETVFCKTLGTQYGVTSRFSAAIRISLPLIPPPCPSGNIDATNIVAPVVTANLPDVQQDVFGLEIRAVDNAQILLHSNLSDADFTNQWVHAQNTSRAQTFFLYTYNLLGEFSDPLEISMTIPEPTVSNFTVDDDNKVLQWTFIGAAGVIVEICKNQFFFTDLTLVQTTSSQHISIPDSEFFPQRWFRVIPYDALGQSSQQPIISHHYTPTIIASFGGNTVAVVPAPSSPSTVPALHPSVAATNPAAVVREIWSNYTRNVGPRFMREL